MKKYPFSLTKHAHDIEYYYNHMNCMIDDVINGDVEMSKEQFDELCDFVDGELYDLYMKMFDGDGYVTYLTGKQIGLAKEIVNWARNSRAEHLIEQGNYEDLKYC